MRTNFAIAFLLGVCATLLAVLVFRPAPAAPLFADAVNAGGFVGVAGNSQPGAKDILWLVDAKGDTPRLCVYEVREQGRLTLLSARNIKYDFQLDKWPTAKDAQSPAVEDVRKIIRDAAAAAEEAKKQQPPK